MQAWYLLYCKRGQLQRAQEHLERQSVNCLTPVITLEKMQRGKRTTVSEPLFLINTKMYAKEFEDAYEEVLCYGIAFYKKRCLVKSK